MDNTANFISDDLLIQSLLLVKTAVAIHVGENAVIQLANDAMLAIWDKDKSVIGKSLEQALPELKGQPFIDLFKRVWNEGITVSGTDTAAELNVNGKLKTFYFDFEYRALLNDAGKTYCILHTATDVTDRVTGKLAMERATENELALEKEQSLNEELANVNEELHSVVEELRQSEESLSDANNELEERVAERTHDLAASERKLQSVLDSMAEGLAIVDIAGNITYINPTGQQLLGITESDATNRTYDDAKWENFTTDGLPLPSEKHPVALMLASSKLIKDFELRINHPYKHEFYVSVTATPLRDANNVMIGGIVSFIDVTERRNYATHISNLNEELSAANEELIVNVDELSTLNNELEGAKADLLRTNSSLIQSELYLYLAAESANIGIWNINPDTKALTYNTVLAKIYGYEGREKMTYDQAIGQVSEEFKDKITAEIDKAIKTSGDYDIVFSQRRFNDGELIWLRSSGKISKDEAGSFLFSGVVIDITDRYNSEQEVQQLNEQLYAINEELTAANEDLAVNNEKLLAANEQITAAKQSVEKQRELLNKFFMQAPAGICVLAGPDLVFQLVNPGYQNLLPNRELLNRPIFEALPELVGTPIQDVILSVYKTGTPYRMDELLVPIAEHDGGATQNRYFTFNYLPRRDDQENVDGILAYVYDVTEQVNTRKKIADAEESLRLAIEAADLGTYSINTQTFEWFASPRLKELFGFSPEEYMPYEAAIGQIGVSHRQAAADLVAKAIAEDIKFDMEYPINYRIGAGIMRWVRGIGTVQTDVDGNSYFTGIVNDITDQVVSKQAIQDLNEQLSAINEELTSSNEELALANESYLFANEELVVSRRLIASAEETLRLATEAASIGTFDMDLEKGSMHWDKRCRILFGISHDREVSYEHDFVNGLYPEDRKRVLAIIDDAFNKAISNGNYDVEYRTIGAEDQKIRWVRARGKVYFNEQDKPVRFLGSVLEITEQKLDDQRKNDFIGMVSHELKTPLTSLSAYIQMLGVKANKTDDTFTIGALDKANKQIRKMTTMINGFLNVARLEAGKIHIDAERFDMAHLVAEIKEEINVTVISHNVLFAPVEETFVTADREKIGQVINNFISNAVKYSSAGTTIQVACIQKNGCAEVCVKDHGFGISAEDQEKLFDRFYRVDNRNTHTISGFGIGLYLSAEIIHRHQGKIWVESEPGKGSTFYFSIPM